MSLSEAPHAGGKSEIIRIVWKRGGRATDICATAAETRVAITFCLANASVRHGGIVVRIVYVYKAAVTCFAYDLILEFVFLRHSRSFFLLDQHPKSARISRVLNITYPDPFS